MRGLWRGLTAFAMLAFASMDLSIAQVAPSTAPTRHAPADIENGRAIVVGAFGEDPSGACFQCHGMDGAGDGAALFPRLTDQAFGYLFNSLKDYASGVRENAIMSPIARALTEAQMRDVAAYYAAQQEAPYPPIEHVTADLLQSGAGLAAVGAVEQAVQGCVNCHGPEGIGLPPSYPYLAGQYAGYLEAQLLGWKQGSRKADGLGVMADIAARLTEEQIRAVAAYYASIRPVAVTPDTDETGFPMVAAGGEAAPDQGR